MYKIKRLVRTGPPIEAEQTEPLKRNPDLPHKPPTKKKMTLEKVDTASISAGLDTRAIRLLTYYNYY